MTRQKQNNISILLILSIVFQIFLAPVFGQTEAMVQELFEKYRASYVDYTNSVAQNLPSVEIQQKFQAYRDAYDAYEKASNAYKAANSDQNASQNTSPTSGVGTGSLTSTGATTGSSTDVQVSTATQVATGIDVTQTTGTATGNVIATSTVDPNDPVTGPFSWFTRVYHQITDPLFGKTDFKQMPLWESILWTVGKALVPTFGVMFATAFLAPLSPLAMIAGGIVTGAALGGIMTYAYEKRMNSKYRDTPKEESKIWRDVSVQATVDAVMAPFNLATGGLFGMVGPTMGSAIYRVAATQAVISFAGGGLSSVAGGVVKHLWATSYFKYPEKIKANEDRINQIMNQHILSNTPLSASETQELDQLRTDNDSMKGEDYSTTDLFKDMERSAVSAALSGFVGSVLADKVYVPGSWADRLSVRIFGSAAQGKQISALFSTMPVNFLGGSSQALIEKSFIDQDIANLRKTQATYPYGSAPNQYFDGAIRQLEQKRDSIDYAQAGFESLINNFAVRSAQLSVQALKYNLYDAPKQRQQAIDDTYRQKDPEWKKANDLYNKYQLVQDEAPNPLKIVNPIAYARALAAFNQKSEIAREAWLSQCIVAQNAESTPANQTLKIQIQEKYDHDLKLNQMLELGRLQGGQAHVDAMKEVLKAEKPELANSSDAELTKLACQAILKTYSDKSAQCTDKLKTMEDTMTKYQDYKNGKVELSVDEAKQLAAQSALISPSQYKAALVEKQVYDLKASGVTWSEVNSRMPEILNATERQTLSRYGGNWATLLSSELYANGLAQYKYKPDGSVNYKDQLQTTAQQIPGLIKSGFVSTYQGNVNNAIVGALIPPNSDAQSSYEKYMGSFAQGALPTTENTILDGLYQISSDLIFSKFGKR
ncbi:MAG: hypothetical protein HQM08_25355 [Candidatus Riflebacteria bacterium]|nr:hypothetical protein [Candidatus Riflebacteria bacterium]